MLTKRPWFALVLILAFPALADAQLRFTQLTANLGELRGGPVYQHRFDFVNEAAEPITITDIRLGCGCLQPVLDKRTYQPGEKGMLLMNLRTLGQPNGSRTWQAHVQYRQADRTAEVALIVAATIRNEVTVEPSIVALTVETTLKQELTIKDHRATSLKVVSVLASSPAIRVHLHPTDGGVTKVTLEVSRSALTAARQEEMLNIYTDDPNYRHLQVPITLIRANRAEVSASPDKVEIRGAGSQLVRLRALGDKAIRVGSAEADQPGITCTWAAGPGNDATLRIRVDPAKAASGNAVVRVQLIEPAMVLAIPVVLRQD
ncbi:MAG: DUF1573 domain-containing protein [Planctomycetes bacterium]|nr:DUF1573 domain-containing protein [Planctomycetota bacterium]